jgi:hypothetical protein
MHYVISSGLLPSVIMVSIIWCEFLASVNMASPNASKDHDIIFDSKSWVEESNISVWNKINHNFRIEKLVTSFWRAGFCLQMKDASDKDSWN